jgi:hypothetical protein
MSETDASIPLISIPKVLFEDNPNAGRGGAACAQFVLANFLHSHSGWGKTGLHTLIYLSILLKCI